MLHISEYVSLGHPDKIADFISCRLLDAYLVADPGTRYAVEVQIKDNHVTLGGEVSSQVQLTDECIANIVCEAVNEIGYTKAYQQQWGAENTICGDDLDVTIHIGQQSPDIAQGLRGWGDQGIFFGYCEYRPNTDGMPLDHSIAKTLCKHLFESGLGGLDIKTQVVMDDAKVRKVIVAIPLLPDDYEYRKRKVKRLVHSVVKGNYELIINGTGAYVKHSSIADCGTTGRKLAVDFYGGNCKIGGGSPWTKDGSKADLALNLVARKLAKRHACENKCDVVVSLACCIGKQEVEFSVCDTAGNTIEYGSFILDPADVIREFKLDTPIYGSMCRWGLFGQYQYDKRWE